MSNTPGKTQEINFYRTRARHGEGTSSRDFEFFLADLPGYGYARAPGSARDRWKPMIEGYLGTPDLRGVIQLIDSRHGATPEDVQMLHFLSDRGVPALLVLTKVDKLKGNARRKELTARMDELSLPEDQVLAVSAATGEGCEELLDSMEALILDDAT